MKTYKLKWPMILGIIGSIYAVIVGFIIGFLATGGVVPGFGSVSFGRMWLLITIMAIAGPVIGLVGASITRNAPKVAGVLLLFAVVEYFVVGVLIGRQSTIPYLLIGGIGTLFMFISAMMALVYPMLPEDNKYTYKTPHVER